MARRNVTLRMNYMHDDDVCTVLDVDFAERRIYIHNTTNNILWRAFGVKEEPTWEDFERFLESRCFPRKHAYLKEAEQAVDADDYAALQGSGVDGHGTPQGAGADGHGTPRDAGADGYGTPQDSGADGYATPQGAGADGHGTPRDSDSHDALQLIERMQGRVAGDHQWIAVEWMKEKPSGENT